MDRQGFLVLTRWCFRNDYHDIVLAWGLDIIEAVSVRLPFMDPRCRDSDSTPHTHALAFGWGHGGLADGGYGCDGAVSWTSRSGAMNSDMMENDCI